MARDSIQSATPSDDAALRQLLRETPLHGNITATLEREPSFFSGVADCLHKDTAISYRHGQPAACGSRLLRQAWWNGQPTVTACLTDLRIHPRYQNRAGRLLIQGFQHLEACATQHPAAVTWTAIFEKNQQARRILTASRAGLPTYTDRGRLLCPAFPVPSKSVFPDIPGISWHTGTTDDWGEIAAFLTSRQQHRPLAPVHSGEGFAEGIRWPGLNANHFILARRSGKLAGTVAIWDQRAFRQFHIRRITGSLRLARVLYNPLARLLGRSGIPADNSILSLAHASFLAVQNDDPALAQPLLRAALAAAARRGIQWLSLCLHESDPLAPALKGLSGISSHGRLYQVSRTPEPWPNTPPIIESALL